jgi:hypothetical protein
VCRGGRARPRPSRMRGGHRLATRSATVMPAEFRMTRQTA